MDLDYTPPDISTSVFFARSRDYGAIRSVLENPLVWRRATGGSVMPCLIEAALDYCNFVLAHEGGRLVAVFLLTQQGTEAADVHLAFSPRAWGRTVPILRAFVAWCWTHTEYTRLVGPVPAHNRLARQLALRAGFVELNGTLEIRKP